MEERQVAVVICYIARLFCFEHQGAVKAAETNYFSNLVTYNVNRPSFLFHVLDSLVNPCNTNPIVPSPARCNNFLNCFVQKISVLRATPGAPHPALDLPI